MCRRGTVVAKMGVAVDRAIILYLVFRDPALYGTPSLQTIAYTLHKPMVGSYALHVPLRTHGDLDV